MYTLVMSSSRLHSWLITLVTVFVAVGTIFVVVRDVPENVTLTSDDGALYLRVKARHDFEPKLITDRGDFTPFLIAQYHVDGLPVADVPAEISIEVPVGEGAEKLVLFARHPKLPIWEPVPDARAVAGAISAHTQVLTAYALGRVEQVEAPEFASDIDALIKQAPKETVSYRIVLTYRHTSPDTSPRILLAGHTKEGECGLELPWDGQELAERSRTAKVKVDGVLADVTFTLTAFYSTRAGGCPEGAALEPRP